MANKVRLGAPAGFRSNCQWHRVAPETADSETGMPQSGDVCEGRQRPGARVVCQWWCAALCARNKARKTKSVRRRVLDHGRASASADNVPYYPSLGYCPLG